MSLNSGSRLLDSRAEDVENEEEVEGEGEEAQKERELQIAELQTWRRRMLDLANVFKSFVGSNFLGMPYAFSLAGVYLGLIAFVVIAIVTTHCCHLLVECKNSFKNRKSIETYGDVGERVFGWSGRLLVDIFLVFTQFFFCVGYMVFIHKNLQCLIGWPDAWLMLLECVAVLPLVLIRNVKYFGIPSLFADLCLLIGVIIVYSFDDLKSKDTAKGWDFAGLPVFFGMVTGALEGIGLVVPVEKTMSALPRRYPLFLNIIMVIVTLLLTSFGILGYLTYGSQTNEIITLNLPGGSAAVKALAILLIIAIVFTYPMQIFPVVEIFENLFWKLLAKYDFRRPKATYFELRGIVIRIILIFLTCIIGYAVPFFGLVSGLTGALGSTSLAYLLPVLFHLKLFYKELHWSIKMKDFLIMGFGLIALGYSTYTAIDAIVKALSNPEPAGNTCL